MRIKDWTVGGLVAYLTGNVLYGEADFFLPADLRGDKGLISGEFEIRQRKTGKDKTKNEKGESKE